MKTLPQIIVFLVIFSNLSAQNLVEEILFPDTLKSSKDSFYISSPKFNEIWAYPISKEDTLNLGTSGYEGVYMTIWTDLDTIKVPHVNYPYRQLIKFPIASSKDTALCILRFQAISSNFSDSYAESHKGTVQIEIPETYELANIILFLSECSQKTKNHPNTNYSQKVTEYFAPFKSHRLIQTLNNNCLNNKVWDTYYGFRENSNCFKFNGETLEYNTPYKHVYWDNSDLRGGQFRNLLYLIQDFVKESNFRKFYSDNQNYYQQLIERQKKLLPVKPMWNWLEQEFPQRMDSYKIIFSPLIGGSHSTQRFQKGFFLEPVYQECVMYINSTEKMDAKQNYSEILKEGLMSGIVFTEIDHNYVNPTTRKHQDLVKGLIKEKDLWASTNAQQHYRKEAAIFNEYMTHALFCLFVTETYNNDLSKQIIDERIKLMEKRGFFLFQRFNEEFLIQMKNRTKTVYQSYPEILNKMKTLK